MRKGLCIVISILLLMMFVPMEGLASAVEGNEVEPPGLNDESCISQNEINEVQNVAYEICHEKLNQGTTTAVANPVHNCTGKNDGTDLTTWSYVYFGSYPQSEITDSATIASIEAAIASGKGDGDTEIDVLVDGAKYRRIRKNDTNNNAYQNDNIYRYFKWERIRWKVLNNNGRTLFVVADKALDCKKYNEELSNITWEECTARSWLNDYFYNMAFDNREQEAIVVQNIVNEDNSVYGIEGGNDTVDRVFLLSIGEATNKSYGFCSDYGVESASRRVQATNYAQAQGTCTFDSSTMGCVNTCRWWLRSPGEYDDLAACVDAGGFGYIMGDDVDLSDGGVAPALHINMASDTWYLTEDGIGGAERGDLANPVHNCTDTNNGTDSTTWSYVYFGSYPQSEVTDSATIASIEGAIASGKGSGDIGIDVWINGTKYRRVSMNDMIDADFGENTYRYFKWERIKWKVLNNNGSSLMVMADKALDCQYYNEKWMETTWEKSTIRNWLNNSFYNTAFNSAEQNIIMAQNLVNEDNLDYGTEGGSDTIDKIYLLSMGDVTNAAYGFCDKSFGQSESRQLLASAYASAGGTNEGKCCWWLRSSGGNSYLSMDVLFSGMIVKAGTAVNDCSIGICPILNMNLSSDIWLLTDDGTSGNGGEEKKNDNINGDSNNNTNDDTNGNIYVDSGNSESNSQTGDEQADASSAVNDVKVTKLIITAPSKELAAGKKVKLSVAVTPSDATNSAVIWRTNNGKYATIDQSGVLTLRQAGAGKTVTVTATATDGSGVQATYKIKIMKDAVKSIKLSATSKSVMARKSINIKAIIKTTGKNVNKSLKWSSSNTKYATVSNSGKVKTKKAGKGKTVIITAVSTDGTNKKAKIKLKIK